MTDGNSSTRSWAIARHFPLVAVLSLATVLRVLGLGWGIPTPEYRHTPFHPDERWALRGLAQLNLAAGDFNPESVQGEGAFFYYPWILVAESLRSLDLIEMPARNERITRDYGDVLLIGRLSNLIYESITICMIYASLMLASGSRRAALLGAMIFAVFPFEVIYSHYARAHVMANTFVSVLIFLSFRLYNRERIGDHFLIGVVTGLAVATRWPVGFAFLIPAIIASILAVERLPGTPLRARAMVSAVLAKNKIFYALPGAALALLVGNPSIVFDLLGVGGSVYGILGYSDPSEFYFASLFDLEKLWGVFKFLIPYGSLPLLWLLIYVAATFSLTRRSKLKYTVPLALFVVSFLYLMGKAYPSPFIRLAMPSFPPLVVLTALGIHEFERLAARRKWITASSRVVVLAIIFSSGGFTLDYVLAMRRADPRIEMSQYIRTADDMNGTFIGLVPSPWNYFLLKPVLSSLPGKKLQVDEAAGELSRIPPGGYLLIADHGSIDQPPTVAETKEQLAASSDFELIVEFGNAPSAVRWATAFLGPPPHDFLYPFPVLSLYRRN